MPGRRTDATTIVPGTIVDGTFAPTSTTRPSDSCPVIRYSCPSGASPYSAALISLSVPSTPTRSTSTRTPRPSGISSSDGSGTSRKCIELGMPGRTATAFMRVLLLRGCGLRRRRPGIRYSRNETSRARAGRIRGFGARSVLRHTRTTRGAVRLHELARFCTPPRPVLITGGFGMRVRSRVGPAGGLRAEVRVRVAELSYAIRSEVAVHHHVCGGADIRTAEVLRFSEGARVPIRVEVRRADPPERLVRAEHDRLLLGEVEVPLRRDDSVPAGTAAVGIGKADGAHERPIGDGGSRQCRDEDRCDHKNSPHGNLLAGRVSDPPILPATRPGCQRSSKVATSCVATAGRGRRLLVVRSARRMSIGANAQHLN